MLELYDESKVINKYGSGDWPTSTHADLRPHAARYSMNVASVAWRLRWVRCVHRKLYVPVAGRFVRFSASGGERFPQNGRFPDQDGDEPPHKIRRR